MMSKLCFFWNTKGRGDQTTINDIIFSVPTTLFHAFREALADTKKPNSHMHWLSTSTSLQPHVLMEFRINHPSNTEKTPNPRYKIIGRPEASGHKMEVGNFE